MATAVSSVPYRRLYLQNILPTPTRTGAFDMGQDRVQKTPPPIYAADGRRLWGDARQGGCYNMRNILLRCG